jgi:two-component system response regulator RegX3
MARTILVVEDEPTLRETLVDALVADGFRAVAAGDGRAALERFRAEQPDLVLLDLMLPELSGIEVCRIIRAESRVPIVMLTARDSEVDKIVGLELGADDYVTKPFSIRELVSRVRAHLRRSQMAAVPYEEDLLAGGPVQMDVGRHEVRVEGEPVLLPPKEFQLLEILLRRQGRLLTRDYLIEEVWGRDYVGDTKTLDVHVKRIRHKIETDPHEPLHLVTVRGLGYKFVS